MAIRALSFDLFDTLVDLGPGVGAAVRTSAEALHAAIREHVEIDLEHFLETLRETDRELREPRHAEGIELSTEERFTRLAQHLGLADPDLPARLTALHMGVLRDQVRVPAHHPDLLRALHRRARLGVCSNFSHAPTAHGILEEANLRPCLDTVVISVEVGVRKPRREIFDALLAGLAVAPEETLHVGDSLRADVAGAAARGMRTAWITRRVVDPDAARAEHDGVAPDFVVWDLKELVGLLEDGGRIE